MKTMKILFTLVVFVMKGLTVSAQAKKDTTVIFKVGIHCPSCKAKLDKDMPFEKGIKDYKLNMKDSTVLISFRTDKNSVEALRAAVGLMLSQMVQGEKTVVDISALRYDRFKPCR